MSDEFFIIAVPKETSSEKTLNEINRQINNNLFSSNFLFAVPDLKVGTLDTLVALSDQLAQTDSFVENLLRRLTQYFAQDILENDQNRILENLVIGHNNANPFQYAREFQWDLAKYPTKQPIANLVEIITKAISHIENDFKNRSQNYQTLKQNLEAFEKRQNGTLLTKSLNDLVKRENFILGSEYLKTLIVCVPRSCVKDWYHKYESLCPMIVPRSTELISQDNEHSLFTVTLFQKVEDTFRHKCRENKFVVREFIYDENQIVSERERIQSMENDRQKLFATLVRWLKINFGELFSAMMHIKAIRTYVESVLRYGLPVNFTAIIMQTNKKACQRLHSSLSQMYSYLDISMTMKTTENIDIPGFYSSEQEYYPYVHLKLELDFIEKKK